MKIHRKLYVVIILVVVITLIGTVFVGCKEEKKTGGEWRGFIMEPVSLDPPSCYEAEGIQVVRQIWDGLVEYDPKTLEVKPAIAESWDISDDGLVYTFELKKGVKFHSGRELTAEDFVYSWSRATSAEGAFPLAYHLEPILGYDELQRGEGDTLTGVKAIDDYTLEVTLKYPYADFINTLGHIVFYPVAKEDIEQWGDEYTEHINGTGAFKFVEWKHDQYIQLERFDDYYGTKALLERAKYIIFSDENTAFTEFKAGNLEYTQIPTGMIQATRDDPVYGDYCLLGRLLQTNFYGMSMNFPLFADNPKLREAINYAIDRENICNVLGEGVSIPMTGFVPPGIPGFQKDAAPYTYDPDHATELLAGAGFPDGEGIPTLIFGYYVGSGQEIYGEAIQSDLSEIGIDMELEGYEWGTFLEKAISGELTFYSLGWNVDYPTMDNFLFPLFYSQSYDNFSGYNNPEVDRLLLEARSTIDRDDRIAKYREIEKIIINDNTFLLISFAGQRRVIQPYVKGFVLDAMENYDLSKVWFAN